MNAILPLRFCRLLVLGAWLFLRPCGASAQLEVVGRDEVPSLFGGGPGTIHVVVSNRGDIASSVAARTRLVQTSSATAIPFSETPWKKLSLLPHQSVVESATVAFPAVKAETRFLLQWLDDANKVFGTTEVRVFPTNLLAQLKVLSGGESLGVFDPANQLQPLLRLHGIEFQDLVEDGTDKFRGRLAIFGPFASKNQIRESLAADLRALAKRGVAVLWLQPPSGLRAGLRPSFYTVRLGDGAVVVAQGDLVSRLAERPEAQLNLIRLAEMALHPEPLDLPETRNAN